MALQPKRAQASILTVSTTVLDVNNTSGVNVGNIHIVNLDANTKQVYVSFVPTGSTMSSGNGILWGTQIGGTGFLSISQPMYLQSGDSIRSSGSLAGMNMYVSYIQNN